MQPPGGRTSERTALVITSNGEMAVALRERLDRAYVTVREVHPAETAAAIAACSPWPWMVVAAVSQPETDVISLVHDAPVVLLWQAPVPTGLPAHTRGFERFAELVTAAHAALTAQVGGMHLAIGSGVSLPGDVHRENAELQALISLHPQPFDLPLRRFSSATRALAQWGAAWTVGSVPGGVVLQPASGAGPERGRRRAAAG